MKEEIATSNAPQAIGPYSQGIKAGGMVFVSGQIPVDPATGQMAQGISNQARQAFKNVMAILEAAGLDASSVVKTTVLLTNMDDFAAMNEVYEEHFVAPYPARACFQVSALPKGASLEIEAIAVCE